MALKKVEKAKPLLRLNLGCGYVKLEGFVNIDNREEVGPDLVCDILQGLPYGDGEIIHVRAYDFLEHIPMDSTIKVIEDIYRVLVPGGIFEHFTPSTDGRGAFQDPNHRSFWNSNSWLYYVEDDYRKLYNIKAKFKILSLENKMTDSRMNIVHTFGVMEKI